jgi:hypothetical protein
MSVGSALVTPSSWGAIQPFQMASASGRSMFDQIKQAGLPSAGFLETSPPREIYGNPSGDHIVVTFTPENTSGASTTFIAEQGGTGYTVHQKGDSLSITRNSDGVKVDLAGATFELSTSGHDAKVTVNGHELGSFFGSGASAAPPTNSAPANNGGPLW